MNAALAKLVAKLRGSHVAGWFLAISSALFAVPAQPSEFPAIIDLSSLDGTNGFRLDGVETGERNDEHFGASVAGNCDVNGDGTADLIIGLRFPYLVHFTTGPPNKTASSYVVFGRPRGNFSPAIDLTRLDGRNGFRLRGLAGTVACAGDVNRDSIADLIVGVSQAKRRGLEDVGSSYVIFGRKASLHRWGFPADVEASDLDGTNGFRLDGERSGDQSGFSVASAGDVNSDGFADIVIGAPGADPRGRGDGGSTYVVFGKAKGFSAHMKLSEINGKDGFRIDGTSGWSGWSVATGGDIDGDGFDDLIIGAPLASYDDRAPAGPACACDGSAYVIFGRASRFPAHIDLANLDGTNGFRLVGYRLLSEAGSSVAGGDFNSDGFADVAIGAPGTLVPAPRAGRIYVMLGRSSGFPDRIDLSKLSPPLGFQLEAVSAWDEAGFAVASAGDVNRDGFRDVIIGAPGADPKGRFDAGSSYVVFGRRAGLASPFSLSGLDGSNGFRLDGEKAGDQSGVSVAGAGDVNGDGIADVIIGALSVDAQGRYHGGPCYVIFGRQHRPRGVEPASDISTE
jgi:hypothetical protein